PRDSKITNFAQKVHPHPQCIQKQYEEALLRWMLCLNQPLSTVTDKAYKEKMAVFDPSFIILEEKKIRTMIMKSYNYNQEDLRNLIQSIKNGLLMTDFWSSKAKHGYLRITATWITPNFEIKDVILENKYIPSPHTSRVIAKELHKCIVSWNLVGRIISITTDNGRNMLAIRKGLALTEILVACSRRLIQFFQYQKQVERLEEVQKKLGYTDVLRCIQDISTYWNSLYYAWDHFFSLKDAIIQLQTDLFISLDREIKKDGNKLKRILLSDDEWELLDQLIDLLILFEEAT
ncbi:25359_t:CDS:2, partial [Racocetra persica]